MTMAKFMLEIDIDNDAFQPDPDIEIARLLHEAGMRVNGGMLGRKSRMGLRDSNGNTVGGYQIIEDA